MEPTNNPMTTVNPTPQPANTTGPVPSLANPVAPAANPVAPVEPVSPVSSTAPVSPAPATTLNTPTAAFDAPAGPAPSTFEAPAAPASFDVPASPAPVAPVAPVITPGTSNPIADSPFFQQTNDVLLDTSPITMPEAPKAPDPVEVELNAPLTPAAPVPGSIGSAVSVPPSDGQQRTPSVSFTDPATQENLMTNVSNPAPVKAKGPKQPLKLSKTTLILIGVVAVLVIVALVVILMSMNS